MAHTEHPNPSEWWNFEAERLARRLLDIAITRMSDEELVQLLARDGGSVPPFTILSATRANLWSFLQGDPVLIYPPRPGP